MKHIVVSRARASERTPLGLMATSAAVAPGPVDGPSPPPPFPLHHFGVELVDTARQVGRAPLAVDAGGAGGPVGQFVTPAALKEDLPVVLHFAHVRAVVIEAHVAHEEDLAAFDVSGELAVDELAARRHAGPVAEVTGRRVLPLQDEAVLALEERRAAVVGAWHLRAGNNHKKY